MSTPRTRYVVSMEDLDGELLDIAQLATRHEVTVEADGRPVYRVVSYKLLQEQIAPLLSQIPSDHPLVIVRQYIEEAVDPQLMDGLADDREKFSVRDAGMLLRQVAFRALVLQILYSVRSQQHLEKDVRHNLLFRWFYGDHYLLCTPPRASEIEGRIADLHSELDLGPLLVGAIEVAERTGPPDVEDFQIDRAQLARWCTSH